MILEKKSAYLKACRIISFILNSTETTPRQKCAALAAQHMITMVGLTETSRNAGHYIDAMRHFVDGSVSEWCSQSVCASWIRGAGVYSNLYKTRTHLLTVEDGSVSDLWGKNLKKFPESCFRYDDPKLTPMMGDAFIRSDTRDELLSGEGSGDRNHTGMILFEMDRIMYVMEGNTNEEGTSSNGGGFFLKTMEMASPRLVGIVRPQFG